MENEKLLTNAYETYRSALFRYSFFKVSDPALSEELVQTTFMKTWAYLKKGGNIGQMQAFLYHVLNGLIIDQYRKEKMLSLDKLIEKGFDVGDTSAERLNETIDQKSLATLTQKLSEKYQRVIMMRYFEGRSIGEIATTLAESRGCVAVRIHRGLAKLNTLLEPVAK